MATEGCTGLQRGKLSNLLPQRRRFPRLAARAGSHDRQFLHLGFEFTVLECEFNLDASMVSPCSSLSALINATLCTTPRIASAWKTSPFLTAASFGSVGHLVLPIFYADDY
jgi:hypothetical protein